MSLIGWDGHTYVERVKIVSGWAQKSRKEENYKRRVVSLKVDGEGKLMKVHRLVAIAFLENPSNKPNINHKDGNPLNNDVRNLEWCTQKENNVHAIETGLKKVAAYENSDDVIRMYESGKSIRRIASKYGACDTTIRKIIKSAGIEIRKTGYYQQRYQINKKELIRDFENGMRNVDIAKKYNTTRTLIGAYKYMFKKGELI